MNSALPQPVGRQKEVLYLPPQGHTVVLGTAGSGKTTLAVHRALYLAHPKTEHYGRTLLVTFNNCLVAYLRSLASSIPSEVDVVNYHKFARGYLNHRRKMWSNCICDQRALQRLCRRVVAEASEAGMTHRILRRPIRLLVEEFRWLAQHGITTAPDYMTSERVGRAGTRIVRSDRPVVFKLYERYKQLRTSDGKKYDWEDLSHTVLSEFDADIGVRHYRHVVIDEGQDFSPMMLRSLAAAIPADGSLTFFGDMAQQIYGNKMSWRSAGLHVQNTWKFKDNYRNTRQIAQLALAIAKMPHFTDDIDLVEPKSPTADGPLPALVSFASEDDELKFIAEQAQRLGQTGSVAVLVRDRDKEREIQQVLPYGATKLHRDLRVWPINPGIFHGTYHSAKGLEFDSVLLPCMSSTHLPHPPDVDDFGINDASTRDQHLIYVAVTRAKSTLILTHAGPCTTLLPADDALYQKHYE